MMNKIASLIFVLSAITMWSVHAINLHEPLSFDFYGYDEGMSDESITGIAEDSLGKIWVSTYFGLHVFDGKKFTVYQSGIDSSRIIRNDILVVYADKDNQLWIGGPNGSVQKFDAHYNRFIDASLNHITLEEYPAFYNFYQNSQSELFALSNNGLYRYSPHTARFHKALREIQEFKQDFFTALYISPQEYTLIGTRRAGLYYLSADSSSFFHIPLITPSGKRVNPTVFYNTSDSTFLVGSSGGIFSLTITESKAIETTFLFADLEGQHVSQITKDSDNNIWIGTWYDGIWIQEHGSNTIQRLSYYDANANRMQRITRIYKDSHNRMWIGTAGNGLFVYNPNLHPIRYVNESYGLSNREVSSFAKDENNNLWVATDGGGIYVYDSSMKLIKHFNKSSGLISSAILCLVQNSTHIWFASWGAGIGKINKSTYEIECYTKESSKLLLNDVKSIAWYNTDTLVIGTHGEGLQFFDCKNKQPISTIELTFGTYMPHEARYINQIAVDAYKNIWVATMRNLYCVKNFVAHDVLESDNFSSPQNPLLVYSVVLDSMHHAIAATNKGVHSINIHTLEPTYIPTQDNIFSSGIHLSVVADTLSQYWIANTQGLFSYYTKTQKHKKYLFSAHTNHMFFMQRAMFIHKEELYVGTYKGFYMFDLNKIFNISPYIRIEFEDAYINNEKIDPPSEFLQYSLNYSKNVEFPYNSQRQISFNTICYELPHTVELAYNFGVDSTWHKIKGDMIIDCSSLKPGTYTLKVKAWQESLGNDTIESIQITIRTPIWYSWWFIILLICGAVLLVWAIIALRTLRIQYEKKLLAAQVKEQVQSLELKTEQIKNQRNELKLLNDKLQEANTELQLQKFDLEELTLQLKEESIEITELNQHLKQSNIAQEQLFTILTTDIVQAFDSLVLLNQSIEHTIHTDNKLKSILSDIQHTVLVHKELLHNIILWAKNQSNSIEVHKKNINPTLFLQNFEAMVESLLHDKNYTITYKYNTDKLFVADEQLLQIALRNILYATLYGSHDGSFILCTTSATATHIEFRIQISLQNLKTELRNFIDLHNTSSHTQSYDFNAHDIYLIVSQQCIEKNGGEFFIHYQAETGIEYKVTFPLQEPAEAKSAVKSNTNLHTKTVAIIDDNEAIAELYASYIAENYNVKVYYDPKIFLDSLQTAHYDIIVSDILMPNIDGYSLCKLVKEKYNTPVILMSSNQQDSTKINVYEAGADSFVAKPIHKSMINAILKNIDSKTADNKSVANTILLPEEAAEDSIFIKKLEAILIQNIASAEFSIEDLAEQLNMSRSQLFRKVKQLHAMSPKEYLIKMRMQTAAEIIKSLPSIKISEVAYSVGFSDPSYFTKCFIKFYGKSPSEYKN